MKKKNLKRLCRDCGVKYAQGTIPSCADCTTKRIGDVRPSWNTHAGRPPKAPAERRSLTSWWIGLDRTQLGTAASNRFAPDPRK